MQKISDEMIPKKLKDQIIGEISAAEYEALSDTAFHVVIQLEDKTFREKSEGWIVVTRAHSVIARDALWLINKETARAGSWVFVWYSPMAGTRQPVDALLLWKDQDGDLICSAEVKNPIGRIYQGESVDWLGIAGAALDRALAFWRDLEIKESQTIKAAQGQQSSNPKAAIPPLSPIA